jgi:hypothetical protein
LPDSTSDRYVTWAMEVPEGVAVPRLFRWLIPQWFPDPDGPFFPRDIVPMYAIRNPADATVYAEDFSTTYDVPAGEWWIFNYPDFYSHIADAYFTGFIPDTSEGTVYPPEAMRDPLPVDPPPWVGDPTPPGTDGDPTTPDNVSPADTPQEST